MKSSTNCGEMVKCHLDVENSRQFNKVGIQDFVKRYRGKEMMDWRNEREWRCASNLKTFSMERGGEMPSGHVSGCKQTVGVGQP
ncbi:unnamed protein product [Mesocestoides corti]|uniref:Ovule protein n=1 Tax=Mesocestoides corti TaxID=53468 RepID=A0A0R3U949_MESCO|nr:unnamed protein product [Mesocestoides corti]